jgi:hypothetical protein
MAANESSLSEPTNLADKLKDATDEVEESERGEDETRSKKTIGRARMEDNNSDRNTREEETQTIGAEEVVRMKRYTRQERRRASGLQRSQRVLAGDSSGRPSGRCANVDAQSTNGKSPKSYPQRDVSVCLAAFR